MPKEDLFIRNIYSRNQDRISVALVYDTLSKEAHRGCGLYYEIYASRLIGLLRAHLS
ncbi:TPA: dpoa decarboxylase, partial [Klebsiella pneumoniae]